MDNILIVGQGSVISALARKLKTCSDVGKIFVAPGDGVNSDKYQNIDIREDDLTGLLKFALDNDIKLTVVTSQKAISADIAVFFAENGQNIFAPSYNACKYFFNRIVEKKFLYKNRIKCPIFSAFSRIQDAKEYLLEAQFPLIISSAQYLDAGDKMICSTFGNAVGFLSDLFNSDCTDVLIEEYIYGKNFTKYYVTDGYSVLPFGSVYSEKFDVNGVKLKNLECISPNFYISEEADSELNTIANNIITSLERRVAPYLGILGISGTITGEGSLVIDGIKPFLQDIDSRAVLNTVSDDLYKIFLSCVNGFFSDEYIEIETNNLNSVAQKINQSKIFQNIEDKDNADFINPESFILTRSANTLSRARKYLLEDISV